MRKDEYRDVDDCVRPFAWKTDDDKKLSYYLQKTCRHMSDSNNSNSRFWANIQNCMYIHRILQNWLNQVGKIMTDCLNWQEYKRIWSTKGLLFLTVSMHETTTTTVDLHFLIIISPLSRLSCWISRCVREERRKVLLSGSPNPENPTRSGQWF